MPIPVVCPGCSARLGAPEDAAAKTIRCPRCKTPVAVPEVLDGIEEPAPVPAATRKPPVRAATPDDEDDEDDRPRRKQARGRRRAAGPPVGLLVGGGVAALLLLAGVGFGVYWFALRTRPAAPGEPGAVAPGAPGGGAKAAVPTGWTAYTPPNAGFKAYYPAAPKNMTRAATPPAGFTRPFTYDYSSQTPTLQVLARVHVFPEAMPVPDREAYLTTALAAGVPKEFVKETSTGKAWVGGKEATEVVHEVDFAAKFGGIRPKGVGGKELPAKVVGVLRHCFVGNRAYAFSLAAPDARPADAELRGFFDNIEFVPVTDPPSGKPAAKQPTPLPKPPDPGTPAPPGLARPTPYTAAGQFQIWFPGPAVHNRARNEGMWKRKLVGSFADHTAQTGLTYHLGYCVFSATASPDDRKKLVDEIAGMLSGEGAGAEVTGRKKVTMAGREWDEVTTKTGDRQVVTRYLDTGRAVYVFAVGGTGGPPPADAQAKFFDSFRFEK